MTALGNSRHSGQGREGIRFAELSYFKRTQGFGGLPFRRLVCDRKKPPDDIRTLEIVDRDFGFERNLFDVLDLNLRDFHQVPIAYRFSSNNGLKVKVNLCNPWANARRGKSTA